MALEYETSHFVPPFLLYLGGDQQSGLRNKESSDEDNKLSKEFSTDNHRRGVNSRYIVRGRFFGGGG